MSETLTVYFVPRTGHVLGTVTRAAGSPTPRAASPETVLVRGGFQGRVDPSFPGFLVPSPQLSTLTLPPDLKLVLSPLGFEVLPQIDAVQPLMGRVRDISMDTNSVRVTVEVAVAQEEPVWVLITREEMIVPRIVVKQVAKGESSVLINLDAPQPGGTYQVLALVGDHLPFAQEVTVGD